MQYIAIDKKEFTDKDECESHEQQLKDTSYLLTDTFKGTLLGYIKGYANALVKQEELLTKDIESIKIVPIINLNE